MRPAEQGFLLLTSHLGNPDRRPLTVPQFRTLVQRMEQADRSVAERDLEPGDLISLGYDPELAERIVCLLGEEELLEHYLRLGRKLGCTPISRISGEYPLRLRKRLGLDAPGCLWAKGNLSLLNGPMVALVGSRDLEGDNYRFAAEAGRQAALQGYTLVSGNARGADRTAQNACLMAGGRVVSIVADELAAQPMNPGVLYLSEDGYGEAFSAQRALSRNRCIHALGDKTLVAQCSYRTGGTWDGSVKNLRFGWSPVFCFDDGSPASELLGQMGAERIGRERLLDLGTLEKSEYSFFDR